MTTHRAEYRVPCDSPEQAERVRKALSVEQDGAPPRTKVDVQALGDLLLLRIDAQDARGLRAATNSFLRWANTALEVDRIASSSPSQRGQGRK